MNRRDARLRRSRRTRSKIKLLAAETGVCRLCVFRSNQHIYAQIINPKGFVVVSAATVEKLIKSENAQGNVASARRIGQLISERAKKEGILKIAFDRSGYKYHGQIKALAEAAREGGLNF
jgi:large subunit ribosomal protein L18